MLGKTDLRQIAANKILMWICTQISFWTHLGGYRYSSLLGQPISKSEMDMKPHKW